MCVAVLGPADGDEEVFGRAAAHFVAMGDVDRVLYLGVDGLLNHVVSAWAHALVGNDASDAGLWARAAGRCATADADVIDAFVVAERRRANLRRLESLSSAGASAVELLGGRWALLTDSMAHLTEEQLAPVSFVVYGDAPELVIHQRGPRWFISPGPLAKIAGLLLYEQESGVGVKVIGPNLDVVRQERLCAGQAAKLRVSDGHSG